MNWTFIYVALVYAAGVILIRRFLPLPWRVAAVFYIVVWAFLFGPLTLSKTHLPVDHILGMYPWRPFHGADAAHNPQLNDVILQLVPWAHQVRESWRAGEVPLWNPAAGTGYPLLANGQSAALSPLRLIALPLGLAQSLACEAALKLLAALTFSFVYMSRRGRSTLASLATALSFGFCGFMTLWLYWNHASVVAFLPALFLAVDLLVEKPSLGGGVFAGVVFALLLLNGHPESAAHVALAGAVYALYLLATPPQRLKSVLYLGGGAVAGVVLALPFLLPFFEAVPLSQRFQTVQHHSLFLPVDARHLVPFVAPLFYGTQRDRNMWGPGMTDEISGYAGILAAVAWVAVLLWRRGERSWRDFSVFHLVAAPVFVVTALGWPPFAWILRLLPPFSIAANGRLRFVAAWSFAIVIGEAIHYIGEGRRRTPLAIGAATAAVLLTLPFLLNRFPKWESVVYAARSVIPAVLVLAAVPLVVLVRDKYRNVSIAALLVSVIIDLWALGRPWYTSFPTRQLFAETPLTSELKRRVSQCAGPCRIAGTAAMLFPNSAAMYGLEDVRAHDPMALGRILGALRVFTGYTSDQYFGMLTDVSSPFLDYLSVRYVITAPHEIEKDERLVEVYSGMDGRILENLNALPRFFSAQEVIIEPDEARRIQTLLTHEDWSRSVIVAEPLDVAGNSRATVQVLSAGPREFRLVVTAPQAALIASSQPLAPGWRIHRGNAMMKPVAVNELFLGFVVPPGTHSVRVVYAPASFRIGVAAAAVMLSALMAALVIRRVAITFRADVQATTIR